MPETKRVLLEMQARVHSATTLNETLYKSANYTRVELASYLETILRHAFKSQAPPTGEVRLVLELEPVDVATAQAIPCGLIANELLTNSLKHGFGDGRSGEVRVGLTHDSLGMTALRVSDTGVGLPKDFSTQSRETLGLQLVDDLARQLQGTYKIGPGTAFTVSFRSRASPLPGL